MTRVAAPSRLHFGLFCVPAGGPTHWPDGLPVRRFGGVGLMVRGPGVTARAEPADHFAGPDRAVEFARRAADRFAPGRRFRVAVESCPPEHVGLGVGTQLGMAVARAVAVESGRPEATADELAEAVGRGERSGIGVRGFAAGGLLADGGKLAPGKVAAVVARVEFPADWRVVLARPAVPAGWFGPRERQAFARPRPPDQALAAAERLARIAVLGLLPAAAEADVGAFGDAVYEFNRRAGEPFAADQGGIYASPAVAAVVAAVRQAGVRGAGQSSWGPTTFAVCPDPDRADHLAADLRARFPDLAAVTVTAAADAGAAVSGTG